MGYLETRGRSGCVKGSLDRERTDCARKIMPGGEVATFAQYPWQTDDEVFMDGPCPYYSHFFSRYTFANGPAYWGARVPFINYFEGILMHRLVRLAPMA